MSKEEIRKEIERILPKKSKEEEYVNDTNALIRVGEYNQALSTTADTLAERSVGVGEIASWLCKILHNRRIKRCEICYQNAQAFTDEFIILRKEK